MKTDRSKHIELFKSEVDTYLTALSQGLVKFEKEPQDKEIVHELLRAAHTIKGAAQMMGFLQIRDVAHKMEDLFCEIRDGKRDFDAGFADPLFHALDAIQSAAANVARGKEEGIDVKGVEGELNALLGEGVSPVGVKPAVEKEIGAESQKEETETVEEPETHEEEYIRVPLSRINYLLNLIGEMVISKVKSSYKVQYFKKITRHAKQVEKMLIDVGTHLKTTLNVPDELIQTKGSVLRSSPELEKASRTLDKFHQVEAAYGHLRENVSNLFDEVQTETFYLNPIIEELQSRMKEIRMLPCSTLFENFPRMVRDIAKERKKSVQLVIEGGETELDKRVLDALKGPLIHVLRNAVDHGVGDDKEGTITLSASQVSGNVVIEVADDGPGIDLDRVRQVALERQVVSEDELSTMTEREVINIIFAEGFSTVPIITDLSGRGVGLDVVRTELERLKGSIVISTQKNKGTTVRIELPLTIAILQVLLVKASAHSWAFPTLDVEETARIPLKSVSTIENRMIAQIRGQSVPLVPLSELVGIQEEDEAGDAASKEELVVIVASSLEKRVGFIVDRIVGGEEVFIKNVGSFLGNVKGVSGAAILASGEVVIILDVPGMIMKSQFAHPAMREQRKPAPRKKPKILIVEDSFTTREMEKSILGNRGYEVDTAIDGLDALSKLSKASYSAVVSDIRMPRMDGFELCESMRRNENFKLIPVIFVTALSTEEEKRKGIEVGARAYITKAQFDQGNLLETLKRLIG